MEFKRVGNSFSCGLIKIEIDDERVLMNKKEVFMCLDGTDIGPIFSTFDKAKDYLTENGMNEKLNNH